MARYTMLVLSQYKNHKLINMLMTLIFAILTVAFIVVSFILVRRDTKSNEEKKESEKLPLFRITGLGYGSCDVFDKSDGKYNGKYDNDKELFASVSTNGIVGDMYAVCNGRKVDNARMVEFQFICGSYSKKCDAVITNDVRQTIYTKKMTDNGIVYMTCPILVNRWGDKTYVLTLKYRVSDVCGVFREWHTADEVIIHKVQ